MDELQKEALEKTVYGLIDNGIVNDYEILKRLKKDHYLKNISQKNCKKIIRKIIEKRLSNKSIDDSFFEFVGDSVEKKENYVFNNDDENYDNLYFGTLDEPLVASEVGDEANKKIYKLKFLNYISKVNSVKFSLDQSSYILGHVLIFSISWINLIIYVFMSLSFTLFFLVRNFAREKDPRIYTEMITTFITIQTILSSLLLYDSFRYFLLTDMITFGFFDIYTLIMNISVCITILLFLNKDEKKVVYQTIFFPTLLIVYFLLILWIGANLLFSCMLLFLFVVASIVYRNYCLKKNVAFIDHHTYVTFIYIMILLTLVFYDFQKFKDSYYQLFERPNSGYCDIDLTTDKKFTNSTLIIKNSNNPNKVLIRNKNFKEKLKKGENRYIYRKC